MKRKGNEIVWTDKTFKTKEAFDRWIARNESKMQWQEIYINNAYGVTYKPLRLINV